MPANASSKWQTSSRCRKICRFPTKASKRPAKGFQQFCHNGSPLSTPVSSPAPPGTASRNLSEPAPPASISLQGSRHTGFAIRNYLLYNRLYQKRGTGRASSMNEQIEFVKEIARRLDSAGICYMFTGSIAMVFYATPRLSEKGHAA